MLWWWNGTHNPTTDIRHSFILPEVSVESPSWILQRVGPDTPFCSYVNVFACADIHFDGAAVGVHRPAVRLELFRLRFVLRRRFETCDSLSWSELFVPKITNRNKEGVILSAKPPTFRLKNILETSTRKWGRQIIRQRVNFIEKPMWFHWESNVLNIFNRNGGKSRWQSDALV